MSADSNLRIAIVGAGPSGLSLAWYLSQLGFRHVEIFEAGSEVGGQSHTEDVGGIPIEMGTCYLADGYIIAREIAEAAGTPPERLPPATFLDKDGKPFIPPMPSTLAMLRYVWKWFGWYLGGQLTKPTDPANALTFDEWLKLKGLGELAASMIFADGCTAQLYGPLKDVTAHNGLSWVRPSLLITGKREDTAHLPAGFQNMWRGLVAHLKLNVRFGQRIDEIRPVREGAGQVELIRDGKPLAERFDHVFVACPLDETPANSGMQLKHPLTDMLRNDFAKFDATEVYSAIWRASHWPLAAASRCYLPASFQGDRGRILTIRQYGKIGEDWVGQLCAYAADNEPPSNEAEALRKNRDRMLEDMKNIVGLRNISILHERLWRYSIRYSPIQLNQGLPAAISARQGVDNVWYTGGALSHWDVDMIANFSQSLAWRFGKRVGLSFLRRLRIIRLRDLFKDL